MSPVSRSSGDPALLLHPFYPFLEVPYCNQDEDRRNEYEYEYEGLRSVCDSTRTVRPTVSYEYSYEYCQAAYRTLFAPRAYPDVQYGTTPYCTVLHSYCTASAMKYRTVLYRTRIRCWSMLHVTVGTVPYLMLQDLEELKRTVLVRCGWRYEYDRTMSFFPLLFLCTFPIYSM